MITRIRKVGNEFALLIPPEVAAQSGFGTDTEVEVTIEQGALVARPVSQKRYTVEELLAGVTDEQLHPETDTGLAVGNEVIRKVETLLR